MTPISDQHDPQGQQDRLPVAAGQDEVQDEDILDNLQDADTLADLSDPGLDSTEDEDMHGLDAQPDGDRQLTTDNDAIDGGLNDSDLGAAEAGLPYNPGTGSEDREGYAELGPDTAQVGGGSTGDRGTGLTDLRG